MDRNIPITASDFSEEFEGTDAESIVLLTKNNALEVWQKYVDEKAASYFHLPNDNWIIRPNKVIFCQYLSDFNNDRSQEVKTKLDSSVSWDDDDSIWFCISKALIIEAS